MYSNAGVCLECFGGQAVGGGMGSIALFSPEMHVIKAEFEGEPKE